MAWEYEHQITPDLVPYDPDYIDPALPDFPPPLPDFRNIIDPASEARVQQLLSVSMQYLLERDRMYGSLRVKNPALEPGSDCPDPALLEDLGETGAEGNGSREQESTSTTPRRQSAAEAWDAWAHPDESLPELCDDLGAANALRSRMASVDRLDRSLCLRCGEEQRTAGSDFCSACSRLSQEAHASQERRADALRDIHVGLRVPYQRLDTEMAAEASPASRGRRKDPAPGKGEYEFQFPVLASLQELDQFADPGRLSPRTGPVSSSSTASDSPRVLDTLYSRTELSPLSDDCEEETEHGVERIGGAMRGKALWSADDTPRRDTTKHRCKRTRHITRKTLRPASKYLGTAEQVAGPSLARALAAMLAGVDLDH